MVVKSFPLVCLLVQAARGGKQKMAINSAYAEYENAIIKALENGTNADAIKEAARRDPAINTDEYYCLAMAN